ncbi:DUF664 domain-containing protein [Aquihabitans sp. G128]|uniref:mycothiol transferase n=1 Tax=Aquihabitans sp. G128 TaxID=2849779 RepID=UPI001C22D521|nr:DUF664 domain-containing protein [Aquihabitans sp. G128]QXC62441.1 DUF664 domain-containing protein [Aquihabitans sp. G128]
MTSTIRHLTFDCRDPFTQARFWAAVLGYTDHPDDPNHPDDPEALIVDPRGLHPGLLFIPVPEPKGLKNRLHLDLVPDVRRDLEVERLLELGATLVDDHRKPDGTGWAVLADPEGNELCVERSSAERPDQSEPVDTGLRPMPAGFHTSGERAMLEAMLDWYRAGVVAKVADASHHVATATPLRSSSSIAGLVKHLALVEDSWWAEDFAGLPEADWYAGVDWDADRDWEFHTVDDEPLALQVERYEAACQRGREIAAGRDLDEIGADTSRREFSLRFVYLHLIEETARHLGHLDVLRELLDGTTGE